MIKTLKDVERMIAQLKAGAPVTRKSKHFDVRFRDESGRESWVRVKALSERHALRIVHRSEAARPA